MDKPTTRLLERYRDWLAKHPEFEGEVYSLDWYGFGVTVSDMPVPEDARVDKRPGGWLHCHWSVDGMVVTRVINTGGK